MKSFLSLQIPKHMYWLMNNSVMTLFLLTAFSAFAQQSGQFRIPENLIDLCRNLENSMIQLSIYELNADRTILSSEATSPEKANAITAKDAIQKSQRVNEDRWYKLGCITLIYRK